MELTINKEMAISFYLAAKEMRGVSTQFLMCVWECVHENDGLLIEFSKLKKQELSSRIGIGVDMLKKHVRKLVEYGFIKHKEEYRGVYTYIPNEDIDFIMSSGEDDKLVFSIGKAGKITDFELLDMDSADNPNEGNFNYTKEGTLQYDETVNRYQLIGEDGSTLYDFHCGDCFMIKYNKEWTPTRIETDSKGKYCLVRPETPVPRWPRKLDNLKVRM